MYGEEEKCAGFWCGNLTARGRSEDLGLDVRMILEWILNRLGGRGLDQSVL